MKKSRLLGVLCVGLVTLFYTMSLHAKTVSVDLATLGFSPGDFVEGTSIEDVTFTSETGNLIFVSSGIPPVLGFAGGGSSGGDADIYMDFSNPIEALSITMADGACRGCDYDAFRISLFDFDTNVLISITDSPIFGGLSSGTDEFTLAIFGTNIGRAIIDPGNSGTLPGVLGLAGGVILTDFEYSNVPLPSAVFFFGSGLLGLIGIAKRKKAT